MTISAFWKTPRGEFMRVVDDSEPDHVTVQSVRPGSARIRIWRSKLNHWEPMADYNNNQIKGQSQ